MSDLTDRIIELERIEARYESLLYKVREDLGTFIKGWDDPTGNSLPANPVFKIALVRDLHKFVEEN